MKKKSVMFRVELRLAKKITHLQKLWSEKNNQKISSTEITLLISKHHLFNKILDEIYSLNKRELEKHVQ